MIEDNERTQRAKDVLLKIINCLEGHDVLSTIDAIYNVLPQLMIQVGMPLEVGMVGLEKSFGYYKELLDKESNPVEESENALQK